MNIFCIGLYDFRIRRSPGKFMQTYWYRNKAKNEAIYGTDFLIGRNRMENVLTERNI